MARWQVTIKQPAGSTPALPPVVLEYFGGEGYGRGELQGLQVGNFTPAGIATLQGSTATLLRYIWSLTVDLPAPDLLKLGALMRWQDKKYAAGLDGHLLLEDEVELLDPEEIPHSKQLLTTIVWPEAPTLGYGFGRFKVKLQHGEEFRKHLGVINPGNGITDGEYMKAAILQAIELP